ncbi:hypothetical protein JCM10212_004541 [Sporobolomyces blumeae]
MPPKSGRQPISSSSFLDLKATISAHESDFKKSRSSGQNHVVGGTAAARSSSSSGAPSKLAQWAKQNKGLASRAAKDQVVYEDDVDNSGRGDPAVIRARLEKKAAIYDKIRRGKTGGLNDAQIDSLLVDFDREPETINGDASDDDDDSNSDSELSEGSVGKGKAKRRDGAAHSEDDDEPGPPLPSTTDPLVEYTDEFGRTRMIPRSEVPRGAPFQVPGDPSGAVDAGTGPEAGSSTGVFQPGEGPQASNILYGDQTSFPVYEPDPAILAQRAATLAAAQAAPLVDHYDSQRETTRQRGAGFYQFSGNEDERQRQMQELQRERDETERKRREREEEGDRVRKVRRDEKDERKRMIEDKRREIEEKRQRRKLGHANGAE